MSYIWGKNHHDCFLKRLIFSSIVWLLIGWAYMGCHLISLTTSSVFTMKMQVYFSIDHMIGYSKRRNSPIYSLLFHISVHLYKNLSDLASRFMYYEEKIQLPTCTQNPCTKWLPCLCSIRNGPLCMKWSLYEIVFVRNDLSWLYDVINKLDRYSIFLL